MPSFDLTAEPWIPVLDAGTDLRITPDAPLVLRHVGLREALLRAHEIREVFAESPLETIALDRLLLALTIDVYQPAPDVDAWTALWRAGRFPAEALDAYLADPARGAERFDLLHPERPFFQLVTPSARDKSVPARLFHEAASGNNATLFNHSLDAVPEPIGLASAARGLVAAQAFGFSGLAGSAIAGGRFPNFSQAPLVGKAQFWIRGRSLAEALLLNGPPDQSARMGAVEHDVPVWRRNPTKGPRSRRHTGLLDVLTWTSRDVSLVVDDLAGDLVVTATYLSPAEKLDPAPTDDPLAAHVASEDSGVYALGFRAGRALWRDATALLQVSSPNVPGASVHDTTG